MPDSVGLGGGVHVERVPVLGEVHLELLEHGRELGGDEVLRLGKVNVLGFL